MDGGRTRVRKPKRYKHHHQLLKDSSFTKRLRVIREKGKKKERKKKEKKACTVACIGVNFDQWGSRSRKTGDCIRCQNLEAEKPISHSNV